MRHSARRGSAATERAGGHYQWESFPLGTLPVRQLGRQQRRHSAYAFCLPRYSVPDGALWAQDRGCFASKLQFWVLTERR